MSFIGGVFNIVGRLPLRVGYMLSDLLAWVASDVVRYRRKVITDNLRSSLPDCDERTLRRVRRGYYNFLADYFFETMRMGRMSEAEMHRRMRFENVGLVEGLLDEGRPVALMLGHYCNWEWVSSLPLSLSKPRDCSQIYHPLENAAADEAFAKIRGRWGSANIALHDTLRYLAAKRSEGVATLTGFIADQAPGYASTHLWLEFLNHETGVYTGPEKIMRRYGGAMVYCRMTRPRRGEYCCTFELITPDVKTTEEFAPTKEYFAKLETDIRRTPRLWLWSHRRWKRPRPQAAPKP